MKAFRQSQVRSYFFGHGSTTLSPHTHRVDFKNLHIFRTVDSEFCQPSRLKPFPHAKPHPPPTASSSNPASSFLPGADEQSDDAESSGRLYEKIKPSMMIQNALLAVTNAEPGDGHEVIRDSSVLGYVYVVDVDEAKQQARLLAPLSGQIPQRAMILGNWPEDVAGLVG